jgi:hypothetical protein
MNLGQIRQAVENETRHFPDLPSHRADLNAVINRVYTAFCNSRTWSFMQRTALLHSFPDLSLPNASVSGNLLLGPRALILPELYDLPVPMYRATAQSDYFDTLLVGAEFGLAADSVVQGPWVIEQVISRSVAGVSGPIVALDPRADFSGGKPSGDFVIRFPRLQLPPDVMTVLSLDSDDGRPIRSLSPIEQRRHLNPADANRPSTSGWFLEDFGHENRIAPVHIDLFLDSTSRSPFVSQREVWPVRETIGLTFSEASGTPTAEQIPADTRVRVFACWFWAGRFGPPSNIVEDTTSGDINTVTVTGLPQLSPGETTIQYGRRVAIFMAEGEGAFFLRAFHNNPNSQTQTILTRNVAGNAEPGLRFPRYDEIVPPGSYKFIRITPRPAALERVSLSYQAHPRQLIEDTDAPEIPDNHEILVWLALADLLASPRYNGAPQMALAMVDRYMRPLEIAYYPQGRYPIRRGMVDQARGRHDFFIGPDIEYIP